MAISPVALLIEELPQRFRGGPSAPTGRFRVKIDRVARDVVLSKKACRVEKVDGRPDAEIATDMHTWRAIQDGKLSGIEAFLDGRLSLRGSIEKSLQFEPAFERPDRGG